MALTPPRQIAVLGATGSIGSSALDVISRHPQQFKASILAAGQQVDALLAACVTHNPKHAVIAEPNLLKTLQQGLSGAGLSTQAHAGQQAIDDLAASDDCDTVIAAIVGAAGLSSTLAAAVAGKRILLANKESLVLAGELLIAAATRAGAEIIPIDSEHSAIFQCLRSRDAANSGVKRILLTASGGPFRGYNREQLAQVTVQQATAHPKWSMGPKISVDSATLMNKGLEVIEAKHLFGVTENQIEVLVHPQSLVHSLVEFIDGSTLAQMGLPDMRTTLAVGLGWPERITSGVAGLDLLQNSRLDFEAPDMQTFSCLRLALQAMATAGTAPAILNAANEVAVAAFLQQKIKFLTIPTVIEHTLSTLGTVSADSLDVLLHADMQARQIAQHAITKQVFHD